MSKQTIIPDKTYIRTLVQQMGRRPVSFNPAYAEIGGSISAGLMIAQAIHWSTHASDDGYFFRTMDKWQEDTALTHDEQRAARRKLRAIEIDGEYLWEETRKGLPAQIYYRLNIGVLASMLIELDSTKPEDKTLELSNTGSREYRTPVVENIEHINKEYEMTNEMTNERECATVPVTPAIESPKRAPNDVWALVAAYCDATGIAEVTNKGKAAGQAKKLLSAGFTPDEIRAAVQWLSGESWIAGAIDLGTILTHADKFRAQRVGRSAPAMTDQPPSPVGYDPLNPSAFLDYQRRYADWKRAHPDLAEEYERRSR